MNNNLRLFIAVELSAQIQQNLATLSETLKKDLGSEVKWVEPHQIHLTLKFLGDTPSTLLPRLKQTLNLSARNQSGFQLEARGTGVFPNVRQPRVLWAGISLPAELVVLQKEIDKQLVPLGYPSDKHPFSPHLTLGRISENANSEAVKLLLKRLQDSSTGTFGSVSIRKVTLFQSTLTPKGPIYTPLERFSLQNPV